MLRAFADEVHHDHTDRHRAAAGCRAQVVDASNDTIGVPDLGRPQPPRLVDHGRIGAHRERHIVAVRVREQPRLLAALDDGPDPVVLNAGEMPDEAEQREVRWGPDGVAIWDASSPCSSSSG